MNRIAWTLKAVRQLGKLPQHDNAAIRDAVNGLADFPNSAHIKRLTNHEYPYRLRVGRYRIFFDFDGTIQVITIEEVKKRDERTY